jgi:HlyD family secretion protein
MTRRATLLACLLVLLLALVGLGWTERGGNTAGVVRAQVSAAIQPEDRDAAPASFRVAAQGRVEPVSETLDLAIGQVGPLAGVYVAEGEEIRKGQLLAEAVNGDQKARLAAVEAQAALRRAELVRLLNGARPEERRQTAAQYARSEASLALAKAQLARQQPLAAKGVASLDMLDQMVAGVGVAQSNEKAAKAAMELINAPPRPEDVEIAKANLALAEANLVEQKVLLEKTQLRSPIDGVVLRRYMKTGETVSIQPLIPIVQVGDMRQLRVRAQLDETDVGRVELGQRASVTASAYPNRRFGGTISRIGQTMGPKTVRSDQPTEKVDTNILDALIDLDDPGVRLPNGLRVNVYVELPRMAGR